MPVVGGSPDPHTHSTEGLPDVSHWLRGDLRSSAWGGQETAPQQGGAGLQPAIADYKSAPRVFSQPRSVMATISLIGNDT